MCRISSHGQTIRSGPPAWRFGKGLTTSHSKTPACCEMLHMVSDLKNFGHKT